MSNKPARGSGPHAVDAGPGNGRVARTGNSASRGWSLLEMMVVVAIIGVILRISLPSMQRTMLAYRLSAAASSAAAAIQQTRYQAIQVGCPYTIVFTSGSKTYQVQRQNISGTPPVCAATFSNVGAAIPWTTGSGISMSPSTTLQFNANGIVSATTGTLSFQLSNGNATRTITVSGVGNVKVTIP